MKVEIFFEFVSQTIWYKNRTSAGLAKHFRVISRFSVVLYEEKWQKGIYFGNEETTEVLGRL